MNALKTLLPVLAMLVTMILSSCDDAHRKQVQVEWQEEYDAYVEAIRSDTTPPSRNLLSFGQQDAAAEEGYRLRRLDQEKGTEVKMTTYSLWCKHCGKRQPDDNDGRGCPECGNRLKTLTDTVTVKRYNGE